LLNEDNRKTVTCERS